MKRVTKTWRSVAVLAAVAATGSAFALGGQASAAPATLSATAIADGVLFNNGPAAALLKSVDRTPVQMTDELRAVEAEVNKAISADKTGYYTSQFSQQMQSGNPRSVRNALSHLGDTTRAVLNQHYGTAKIDAAVKQFADAVNAKPVEKDKSTAMDEARISCLVLMCQIVVSPLVLPAITGQDSALAAERMTAQITHGLRS
jgi:hypothetical protein